MKIIIEDGKTIRLPTVTEEGIYGFFSSYRWMSNFHMFSITMDDGLTYPCTENAYQAYKLISIEERKQFNNNRTKDLKRDNKFMKLVWDIEDRLSKLSAKDKK